MPNAALATLYKYNRTNGKKRKRWRKCLFEIALKPRTEEDKAYRDKIMQGKLAVKPMCPKYWSLNCFQFYN